MLSKKLINPEGSSINSLKRALVNLEVSGIKYKELYLSMKEGVAINEMIFNDEGIPVDYKIIDVNPSYENIFRLKKENILNATSKDIFNTNSPPFIANYSKGILANEISNFEAFFAPLHRYLKISVFVIDKSTFVTIFSDITTSKIEENILFSNSENLHKLNIKLEKAKLEIKFALQELEEFKAKFNSLISASEVQVYICSIDYVLEYTNVSYINNNINIKNLKKCYELIYNKNEPCPWCPIQKVLSQRKVITFDYENNNNYYHLIASPLEPTNCKSVMTIVSNVTRNKEIFSEVIEANQNLKAIYEGSLNGIAMINKEGKVAFWNQAAEKDLFYEKNDIIGKNILDIIPEKYHKTFKIEFEEFKSTSKTAFYGYPVVVSAIRKGGTEINIELSLSFVKNKGEILLLAIFRDVTDKRNALEKLKETRFNNKALFENAFVPIVVIDKKADIIFLNKAAKKELTLTNKDNDNSNIFNYISQDNCQIFKDIFERFKSINPTDFSDDPFTLVLKDSSSNTFTAEIYLSPLIFEGESKLLFSFNKTDSNFKDNEYQIANYNAMFDTEMFAFMTIDNKGVITSLNKGAEVLLDYKESEIKDQSLLKLIPARHKEYFNDILLNFYLNNETEDTFKNYETTLVKKDNLELIVELSIKKVTMNGRSHALINFKDITEMKVLEDRLNKVKLAFKGPSCQIDKTLDPFEKILKYTNADKIHFLSQISHELRTPLNAILGFAELLNKKYYGDLSAKQSEYVKLIHSSGQLLLSFISDMIELAKVDAGTMDFKLDSLQAKNVIIEVINMLNPQFSAKNVELIVNIDNENVNVLAEKGKFKQILINLLSNALKFTPHGGIVSISTGYKSEKYVIFYIKDSGCGINETENENIFKEFYQADKARDQALGGAGIGLALVKRLVKIHGGDVGVESQIGKGSTFWFTLPLALNKA